MPIKAKNTNFKVRKYLIWPIKSQNDKGVKIDTFWNFTLDGLLRHLNHLHTNTYDKNPAKPLFSTYHNTWGAN